MNDVAFRCHCCGTPLYPSDHPGLAINRVASLRARKVLLEEELRNLGGKPGGNGGERDRRFKRNLEIQAEIIEIDRAIERTR